MTIAIDGRALQGACGGIDIYIHQLLKHLFSIDSVNRYIVFFNGVATVKHDSAARHGNVRIIQTHIPSKIFNASLALFGFPTLDRYWEWAAGEHIDMFFMPNSNFGSFSSKARLVLTIHDLSYRHFSHLQSLRGKIWHASIRPDALIRRADAIIAVSKSCKNDVLSVYDIPSQSIKVIPLGIDESFSCHNDEQKEELPIIVAYCPQEGRKNCETLIEAFAHARNMNDSIRKSLLVFGGVTTVPKRIRNKLKEYAIEQFVRFVPYLPLHKRQRLLQSARVCVYPSVYEGFGFPPLEAIAARVPVIAGAHSSIPDVSGEGVWYCDPYDVCSLSESLVTVYTNERVREQLIASRKQLLSRFDWNTTAEQTLKLFCSVCE